MADRFTIIWRVCERGEQRGTVTWILLTIVFRLFLFPHFTTALGEISAPVVLKYALDIAAGMRWALGTSAVSQPSPFSLL